MRQANQRWHAGENFAPAFTEATAEAIGRSKRSVQIDAARGEALGEDGAPTAMLQAISILRIAPTMSCAQVAQSHDQSGLGLIVSFTCSFQRHCAPHILVE